MFTNWFNKRNMHLLKSIAAVEVQLLNIKNVMRAIIAGIRGVRQFTLSSSPGFTRVSHLQFVNRSESSDDLEYDTDAITPFYWKRV